MNFSPPPSQGSLKGILVSGVYILGGGSNCLIRCMDWIYGTGLAFIDNVDVATFIRNLNEGITVGKSLSFLFLSYFTCGWGLGFK